MICFPLDNQTYTAKALGAYLGTRTRGVYCAGANLQVTANGNYTLTVQPGLCWFSAGEFWGACGLVETPVLLELTPADGELSRIDAICARLDKTRNLAEVIVKQGSYGLKPVTPAPQRDTECDELVLATVTIPAGATDISAGNLTDTRLNENLCGMMRDGVNGIPTQALYDQYMATLDVLQTSLSRVLDGSEHLLKTAYDLDGKVAEHGGIQAVVDTVEQKALSAAVAAQTTANAAMPKVGGTFTGVVTAAAGNSNKTVRNVFTSTAASWPPGYGLGDILLVYV